MCRLWNLTVDGATGFAGAAIVDGYPDREPATTGEPVLHCCAGINTVWRAPAQTVQRQLRLRNNPTFSYFLLPPAPPSRLSLSPAPAAVVLVAEQAPVDGARAFNGSFAADDISPEVSRSRSLGELQSRVCMGHIFVSADVAGGTIYGRLDYKPKADETQDARTGCEAAAKKAMEDDGADPVMNHSSMAGMDPSGGAMMDAEDSVEDAGANTVTGAAEQAANTTVAPAPAPSAAARAVLGAVALALAALMS